MPRPDLATGVLLLAHRRLATLASALRTKQGLVDVSADVVNNRRAVVKRQTEARALAMVDAALAMLQDGDRIPLPSDARLGHGVSRAAVTGTLGLGLPAIAGLIDPAHAWYRQAVHRASADANLSRVAVPSTELVLDVGRRALGHATTDDDRRKVRGMTLGMLADVATRTLVSPVLRGATPRADGDVDLATAAAAVRAGGLTAERLMGGRAGAAWGDWWLQRRDVPAAFFTGYAEALTDLHAVFEPPLGFQSTLAGQTRDTLTSDHLGRAYDLFRGGSFDIFHPGIPAVGAGMNLGEWFAMMIPAFIAPPIALLESAAHDRGKLLWEPATSSTPPDTTSWLDLAALGGLWGSITPLIYPMLMWKRYPGSSYPFWETIGFTVVRAIAGLGGVLSGTDTDARIGWLVTQLVPDLVALVQMVVEIALGHRGAALIMMIELLPAVCMGLTMLAGAAFRGAGVTWGWDSFFPAWLIVLVICLALSFVVGAIIHAEGGFRLVVQPDRTETRQLAAIHRLGRLPAAALPEPRAPALVFDDGALYLIPGQGGGAPDRTHFAFPPGPRPLLRLSWAGSRPLTLTVRGARLSFQIGGDAPIEVLATPGITAERLAARLVAAVVDGGTQHLTAAQAADAELQPPLSFPRPFEDLGATITISSDAANPTVLRAAPRRATAIEFGADGPLRSALEGWKVVPSSLLGDTDATAMGAAADLAALLFLGSVPELAAAPVVAPGGELRRVHEVFRRWNLDERSANEWRMLVAGAARSERFAGDDPTCRTPVVVAPPDDPQARKLLEQMGWIPAWRAWMRMAADPTQDSAGNGAAPYTPPGGPGSADAPSNDLLSRAVRLLLNL